MQFLYPDFLAYISGAAVSQLSAVPPRPECSIRLNSGGVGAPAGYGYCVFQNLHRGHLVIAVSGSPLELVEAMAKKYNFDDCKGTVYKVDDKGYYTGEIIPMWDHESKRKALNELKERYDIDFESSYAYGDTTGDLDMFNLVGHPYAINPTHELLDKISLSKPLKDKINIIVERKNVIYHLDPNNININ